MKPELFAKVSLPEVLKNSPDATDVITRIQYGANAIFSFSKATKMNEDSKEVEGYIFSPHYNAQFVNPFFCTESLIEIM